MRPADLIVSFLYKLALIIATPFASEWAKRLSLRHFHPKRNRTTVPHMAKVFTIVQTMEQLRADYQMEARSSSVELDDLLADCQCFLLRVKPMLQQIAVQRRKIGPLSTQALQDCHAAADLLKRLEALKPRSE